jgi:hypothetical protein
VAGSERQTTAFAESAGQWTSVGLAVDPMRPFRANTAACQEALFRPENIAEMAPDETGREGRSRISKPPKKTTHFYDY